MRTDPAALHSALVILAEEIQSDDGVANAVISEAANLLNDLLGVAGYWYGISECDCASPLPQGGCLKCDLEKLLKPNAKHS